MVTAGVTVLLYSYCTHIVCTVTDFCHASHSKWQKSVTTTFSYGIFGSENTWVCTVTLWLQYKHRYFRIENGCLCTVTLYRGLQRWKSLKCPNDKHLSDFFNCRKREYSTRTTVCQHKNRTNFRNICLIFNMDYVTIKLK